MVVFFFSLQNDPHLIEESRRQSTDGLGIAIVTDRGGALSHCAIVAREFLVSGLRLAAIEKGVVIAARDLGKLKTWAQAVAVAVGGMAAAGAWSSDVAWWVLLLAVLLTWISGLDYARAAPRLLRNEGA